MKFRFHSSTIKVKSCWSSASATPLRRECLPMFCFHNRAVDGSVFMMFCNSAQGVMSWQSSASATQLRRECLQEVRQFRCWGECLHEVLLPQLGSNGNVMSQSHCKWECLHKVPQFHSGGNVMAKFHFCNSPQKEVSPWSFRCYGECLHKVPLLQLHSWGYVI